MNTDEGSFNGNTTNHHRLIHLDNVGIYIFIVEFGYLISLSWICSLQTETKFHLYKFAALFSHSFFYKFTLLQIRGVLFQVRMYWLSPISLLYTCSYMYGMYFLKCDARKKWFACEMLKISDQNADRFCDVSKAVIVRCQKQSAL